MPMILPTKEELPILTQYVRVCTLMFAGTCALVLLAAGIALVNQVAYRPTVADWNGRLSYGTPDLECATWYRPQGDIRECHNPKVNQ